MSSRKSRRDKERRLANLGPVSTRWLNEIGIYTIADLSSIGAIMTYRILKHQNPAVSLNLLYALHAALTERSWTELSPDEKAELRRKAAEPISISVGEGAKVVGGS